VRRQLGDALLERLDYVRGRAVVAEPGKQDLAGLALDKRRDRRFALRTDQQVTLPLAGNATLVDLRRGLGDRDHVRDSAARIDAPPRAAR
jgi:hypothetical protein